jgi:hypothetical protein
LQAWTGTTSLEAKGLIRVRMGKGGKERIVPAHPDVMEALRCLPLPRTVAIFVRPMGGRYSPNRMSATCNRYLHDAGFVTGAHFHSKAVSPLPSQCRPELSPTKQASPGDQALVNRALITT